MDRGPTWRAGFAPVRKEPHGRGGARLRGVPTESEKVGFLDQDFYDCLRWLVVAAHAWEAPPQRRIDHQQVLAMMTALVQARALYEFYRPGDGGDDGARVAHFCPPGTDVSTLLDSHPSLKRYLGHGRAANKRLFHPVYGRPGHAGGDQPDESDHLKNQVRLVAESMVDVTRGFVRLAEPRYRQRIEGALRRALVDGIRAAAAYGLDKPIR